jgi:hypothetical protein
MISWAKHCPDDDVGPPHGRDVFAEFVGTGADMVGEVVLDDEERGELSVSSSLSPAAMTSCTSSVGTMCEQRRRASPSFGVHEVDGLTEGGVERTNVASCGYWRSSWEDLTVTGGRVADSSLDADSFVVGIRQPAHPVPSPPEPGVGPTLMTDSRRELNP